MTRIVFDHIKFLNYMSESPEVRSRAAKLGWIGHDLAALKRSCASVKGWDTRRRG